MSDTRENLWAPWRIDYLRGLESDARAASPSGCFLCDAAKSGLTDDEKRQRMVLHRTEHGVLMMNRFPYSNGHLLAAPAEHVPDLSDLSAAGRAGLMELGELGVRLLKRAMHAQGANIGLNLGRCAGAGVPGHLHLHVVPRWEGDVNFMAVTGRVRVIPQAVEDSYQAILEVLGEELG